MKIECVSEISPPIDAPGFEPAETGVVRCERAAAATVERCIARLAEALGRPMVVRSVSVVPVELRDVVRLLVVVVADDSAPAGEVRHAPRRPGSPP